MDFFASQDRARRKTVQLVVLFALAIVSMIVLANLVVAFALGFFSSDNGQQPQLPWSVFFSISLAIITLVGGGSAYKIRQLSGGGDRIAQQLDGEIVFPDDADFTRRRLHNIVEEMAIASGVPVPSVYIIEGEGINAFAAGNSYSDAIIGVTRGALKQLPRSELQGVIAHEFSHILNGDMRLNTRLIGVLHGILLIGIIGSYLLRFSPSRSRNSKNSGNLAILGLGLLVVGYSGTFFGNLIKAAVNRQREYLADSAAVQFTRNPEGIAGALIRIGSTEMGSVLKQPEIAEISHTLFSQGLKSFFATHPPLAKRIKKILPIWDGEFTPLTKKTKTSSEPTQKKKPAGPALSAKEAALLTAATVLSQGEKLVETIGRPEQKNLDYAKQFIDNLPRQLAENLHYSYGAQAAIYALVLDHDPEERQRQLAYLRARLQQENVKEVERIAVQISSLKSSQRLPIVDLALPALRQLSEKQYQHFRENLTALILSDQRISFFEWILQKVVIHHLDQVFGRPATLKKNINIHRAGEAASMLLSVFLLHVREKVISREELVNRLLAEIRWLDADQLKSQTTITLEDLDKVLNDLTILKIQFKKTLLEACATVVMADSHISIREKELLRAVSSSLNCPVPLLEY